jgi:hypothetical protein
LLAWIFIGIVIAIIFGVDFVRRWKRDNAWKHRWNDERDDD